MKVMQVGDDAFQRLLANGGEVYVLLLWGELLS